jgi:hypothetical protein
VNALLKYGGMGAAVLCSCLVACLALCASCAKSPASDVDDKVTTLGDTEVTAQLEEIRGEFVDQTNYDYAFVMRYKVLKVHRGKVDSDTIYVGHYNPLTPRASVADERVKDVGGTLKRFRAGDVHRMALASPMDDCFMGGVINRYFEEYKGPVYWALWTNPGVKP